MTRCDWSNLTGPPYRHDILRPKPNYRTHFPFVGVLLEKLGSSSDLAPLEVQIVHKACLYSSVAITDTFCI